MKRRAIYVEIDIRADLDAVWETTQNTDQHPRWDVRFSSITPTGKDPQTGATHFEYALRIPFHTIKGTGVNVGETSRPDGSRTSALKFFTSDWLSPIGPGRGYWRYVPSERGVRFLTGYDYQPGWGVLDIVVRPLLGWATAWSFDRLRIWLETGVEPEQWNLLSVLQWWRPDRPRARNCLRSPPGRRRREVDLKDAPDTLHTLPQPTGSQ